MAPTAASTYGITLLQELVYWSEKANPGDSNVARAYRVRGPLDQGALVDAFKAVLARHDALRMQFFVDDDSRVRGRILPACDLPVSFHRVSPGDVAEAERLATVERFWGFDLDSAPHSKLSIIALGEDDHIIIPIFSHMVMDGWSLGVFLRELGAFYNASIDGGACDLPPPRAGWRDWQEATVLPRYADMLAETRWITKLGPLVGQSTTPVAFDDVSVAIEGTGLEVLREVARAAGVTMFSFLTTLCAGLLCEQRRPPSLSFFFHQRSRPKFGAVIGCLTATVPLLVELTDEMTISAAACTADAAIASSIAHPYAKGGRPLPASLNYYVEMTPPQLRGLTLSPVKLPLPVPRTADIYFEAVESTTRERLDLRICYKSRLFTRSAMAGVVGRFPELVDHLHQRPETKLGTILSLPSASKSAGREGSHHPVR